MRSPFATAGLLLFACACGSVPVVNDPIRGRDDSVVVPVVRALVRLPRVSGLAEGEGLYVQGSVSSVDGNFRQGSRRTMFGGQVVSGQLDVDFEMTEVSAAFGINQEFGDYFSGDFFSGLGYQDLSLEVGWSGGRAKEVKNGLGWLLGAQLDAELREWVSVYLRGELLVLPASTHTFKIEVGFDFELARNLDLLVGYRSWQYEHDHGRPELDLDARGLLVGMGLRW